MAVIRITPADVKMLQVKENGWYGASITQVSDPTPNKAKDSLNTIIVFTLEDGKEIKQYYSHKLIAMILPLVEAVTETKVPIEGFELDTDILKGKKCDLKLTTVIFNGNPKNEIEAYLPYGQGKNQQAPF